ncbi:MAG: TIGR04282 family arsenosugar biosynthesis glycosyltransferase [Gammaproteobacteria bacterium]|nr:TIGR04282 family arsenosugar biosynthesis glycosyltransferase [Gammaproteobacteria bacterium]
MSKAEKTAVKVLLFAKAPVAGYCKTRLIPALGLEATTHLHQKMINHCLATLQTMQRRNHKLYSYELWSDDSQHAFIAQAGATHQIKIQQQSGTDLGQKMFNALNTALKTSKKVILIGSDCPEIDSDYIDLAKQKLDSCDVVIGPAIDGGYVLIAVRKITPEIFNYINWGSDQVLQQTKSQLQQSSLSWCLLSALTDIDTAADLQRLANKPEYDWLRC